MEDKIEKLKELGELLKSSVISQVEFEQLKAEILGMNNVSKPESSSISNDKNTISEHQIDVQKNIIETSELNVNNDIKKSDKNNFTFILIFFGIIIIPYSFYHSIVDVANYLITSSSYESEEGKTAPDVCDCINNALKITTPQFDVNLQKKCEDYSKTLSQKGKDERVKEGIRRGCLQ
jgi:hypothetical protein